MGARTGGVVLGALVERGTVGADGAIEADVTIKVGVVV